MVQEHRPDLVVTEIVLSKMDGIEVLDALAGMELERRPKRGLAIFFLLLLAGVIAALAWWYFGGGL